MDEALEEIENTLYRSGCWVTLENKLDDLMSEWSLLSDQCQWHDGDSMCTHMSNDTCECEWDECPRVKS